MDTYNKIDQGGLCMSLPQSGGPANDITSKDCHSCKKSDGKLFSSLLTVYLCVQWIIFFGSLAMLITLRIRFDFFIQDVQDRWKGKCFDRLTIMLGVMYAVSTLGIIELFLYKDSIKKIAHKNLSIRTWLKLLIEGLSVLYFIADIIIVWGMRVFGGCGKDADGVEDTVNIKKAENIFIYAIGLYSSNLISFILYTILRKIIQNDEKIKMYFDNFVKVKY